MARHLLPRSERTRRVAVLGGALGIGLLGYSIVSVDDGADPDQGGDPAPATSEPTVLGAVITTDEALPEAAPASPVSISAAADAPGTESPVTTSAPPPPRTSPATSPPATAPPPTTASTQPPPTLVPPTVVENTTTTSPPSTTTTEPPPDPEP